MILRPVDARGANVLRADVVVVGAGPAGIGLALELAALRLDVLLIESGSRRVDHRTQSLSELASFDPDVHALAEVAVRRQLGGASAIWGGRCVPYDPVDFASRPYIDGSWPVAYESVARHHERACQLLQCGRPVFDAEETGYLPDSIVPGLKNDEMRTTTLERWSLPTDFGRSYYADLKRSSTVQVVSGYTAVRLVTTAIGDAESTSKILARSLEGHELEVVGRAYVIAAGGLETTRLLLASPSLSGRPVGDHSGHLGRWYMSHVEGSVATICFTTDPEKTIFGYERDVDGTFVRRRFTFRDDFLVDHELPNIAGWLANPLLADSGHGSGPLSFVYMALKSPVGRALAPDAQRLSLTGAHVPGSPYGPSAQSPLRKHAANIGSHPVDTARFIYRFGTGRFAHRRKIPGFFVPQASNEYPFQYHSEHAPSYSSRVTLADVRDPLGVPRLDVDLRFSESDTDGVVRAHEHWDRLLRAQRIGCLRFSDPDPNEAVRRLAGGGFHQIGTTRMSRHARDGVVDPNLAVHGMANTYVLSSSVFPTSGQANSTFQILALAVRLAEHLGKSVLA